MQYSEVNKNNSTLDTIYFRTDVRESDADIVAHLVHQTGFFYEHEVLIAKELAQEASTKGEGSGYHFLFVETKNSNSVLGYACYGEIPCTRGSYDLYWIVVGKEFQSRGLGSLILREVEKQVFLKGGRSIYIETSGRPLYTATQKFYQRNEYTLVATLPNFYDQGDDKLIFSKVLVPFS